MKSEALMKVIAFCLILLTIVIGIFLLGVLPFFRMQEMNLTTKKYQDCKTDYADYSVKAFEKCL